MYVLFSKHPFVFHIFWGLVSDFVGVGRARRRYGFSRSGWRLVLAISLAFDKKIKRRFAPSIHI
jgi:hypothetical protein